MSLIFIFFDSRIDPVNKLHEVQKEISSLHVLYSANPIFGIQHVTQVENYIAFCYKKIGQIE